MKTFLIEGLPIHSRNMNDTLQKNGTGMTKGIRDRMCKGHTSVLSLGIALAAMFSAHGEILLDEGFETPDVTTTSLLQDGGTYHKGSLPTGGKWVGATKGYGANRIGIINKTFGDFTATADNHQGFYFGYTNSGLTSSTSAITHTLELGATYTLTFDVARDNNKAQSSYTVQLVAFDLEENDSVRNDVRPESSPGVVLATLNGTVTTNDFSERASLVFQPDETIHYSDVGKAMGIRFLGNSSNPIVDNVQLVVEGGIGQGAIPDSDNDGLPDAWEIANFGNLNHDGTSDLDRDGLSDAFEYSANLNPNDYDSVNGIPDWVGYLDTVNGETLLTEEFENPNVIGTSALQFGATFEKGKLPANGKWVGSTQGFGADRKGLIHKNFGDFSNPDGSDQGCYFGYSNTGITSSAAALSHVLDLDEIYVLSFDVARDNDKIQSSYTMELVAFSPQQGDSARTDTRDGSRPGVVLSSASGVVISNDMSKRVTMIFKPDATTHAAQFGKSLGLRFLGNSSCPILDNVSLKAIDTKTMEPGAPGYLTVEHWDGVPGQTLTDLFANQAFYQDANWIYLSPWAKSLSNVGDEYGVRMTGRIIARSTGAYHFIIAGGGECRLFLSTDEKAYNRREIAFSPNPIAEENWYDGPVSSKVNLVAGNEYYIEVLMKEDSAADYVSVAWQYLPPAAAPGEPQAIPLPFEIIPGSSLKSYMPDAGDLDDDGMLDSWEEQVGLNSNDNGGTNRNQGSYADIDGDGLLNYEEYQYHTSPLNSDSDGDGMPDGWEVQYNLNPIVPGDSDADGDGMSNLQEFQTGTNPNNADTDGDGATDGDENGGNTDPTDPGSAPQEGWIIWSGDLEEDERKALNRTITIPKGQTRIVIVALHSEEYPDYTEQISEFNDLLEWKITSAGGPGIADMANVNDKHVDWQIAGFEGTVIKNFYPAHIEKISSLTAPAEADLTVTLDLAATNIGDGDLPSTVMVGLLPVEVAVDADRDGEITFDQKDKTTAEKPYRFWINNDQDDVEADEPVNVDDNDRDLLDNTIKTKRDLEDFSRIRLSVGLPLDELKDGSWKVGLKFKDTGGQNPAIRIWPNESDTGSNSFLDEGTAAGRQIAKQPFGETYSGTVFIPASYWTDRSDTEAHLIFEGTKKGTGELVLVVKKDGQSEIETTSLYLNLLDVREMFQRARIVNSASQIPNPWVDDTPPAQAWVWDPWNWPYSEDPDVEESTAIFVHGWRLTYNEYLNWAQTSYKRLWHQGFKGKFYSFRWATLSGDQSNFEGYLTYNPSEYRAWLCGPALASWVNSLPGSSTNRSLFAHSMGNVISGSALRAGMVVERYALCNAAMASMAYDSSPGLKIDPVNGQSWDKIWGNLGPQKTPDTDPSATIRSTFGLENKFNDGSNLPQMINFYLREDDALKSWIDNNRFFKPDDSSHSYYYQETPIAPNISYKLFQAPPVGNPREITSPPEAFGYVTKAITRTTGSDPRTGGSIGSSVNMDDWGVGANHSGFGVTHSAQWRWSNQSTSLFWKKLCEDLELTE